MIRTKEWHDPLVQRLIQRHRGKPPEEIIEAEVGKWLAKSGENELPIDVEALASFLGVRPRPTDHDFDGRIFANTENKLILEYRSSDPEPRQRFTIAHELVHILFPGFVQDGRYRSDTETGTPKRVLAEEEWLCDFGAAAILMPRFELWRYPVRAGLHSVERLARDAKVSLEAAGIRIVSTSEEPALFLVAEQESSPTEGVRPAHRVRYVVSPQLNIFVPRQHALDREPVFSRAIRSGRRERRRGLLPGRNNGRSFEIDAQSFPRREGKGQLGRLLAIARPAD